MPKRPKFLDNNDNLDPLDTGTTNSGLEAWQSMDSQIFDEIKATQAQIKRLKQIDIFNIQPDLKQPRRVMPSAVRSMWDGTAEGLEDAFGHWLSVVEEERGTVFDLSLFLDVGAEDSDDESSEKNVESPIIVERDEDYAPGTLENALLQIVTLAGSIRRDGLTNPISVAEQKRADSYTLETGERRWLAFHLLWLWFDGSADNRPDERENWQHISCQTVTEVNVWRQANENNARADLNAIGKARQYAVLLMDLIEDTDFKPINNFSHEREFYAQVATASVPYGKSEQLLTSMGVTNRSALSRYRKLLRLPNEIWQQADDRSMAEEPLVNLAKLAEKSPEHAIERFNQIVAGRNISVSDKQHGPGTRRHFSQLTSTIQKAGHGKKEINTKALKAVDELRKWLDQQEEIIRKYLE